MHSKYLNLIKKLLGASFVAWENTKDSKYLKVIINKKEIIVPFQGELITENSYKDLINNMLSYGRSEIQEAV